MKRVNQIRMSDAFKVFKIKQFQVYVSVELLV